MATNPVLQEWVMELPLKMQSVLMTSTRGPDNHRYASVKVVNRWIRSRLFKDADPANPFIINTDDPFPWEDSFLDILEHDLEYVTVHYFGHLIHSLEIIAYNHPNFVDQKRFFRVYREVCGRILHLPVEQANTMDARLQDKTDGVVHK